MLSTSISIWNYISIHSQIPSLIPNTSSGFTLKFSLLSNTGALIRYPLSFGGLNPNYCSLPLTSFTINVCLLHSHCLSLAFSSSVFFILTVCLFHPHCLCFSLWLSVSFILTVCLFHVSFILTVCPFHHHYLSRWLSLYVSLTLTICLFHSHYLSLWLSLWRWLGCLVDSHCLSV